MKNLINVPNLWSKISLPFVLGMILLFNAFSSNSQQLPECDANVPFFILNLSSSPDSTYTTPEIVRQGQCCGGNSNDNYVSFYVTLHPDVAMVEIGIEPGYADPGGSGNYNIISGGDLLTPGTCGVDIPGGQTACITGSGPHKITYYKPGKNKVKYYLKQIPKPIYPQDDTTRVGCSLPLNIYGLDNISITSINSSTGNTTLGSYNSLLSCTDCDAPSFSPGLSTPEWIDYKICGTPQASACGVYQSCDTVRLYTANLLEVFVTPNPAQFCLGGNVDLTSNATGGDGNYTFNWFDSDGNNLSTSDVYNATAAGTYTVEVADGLVSATCPEEYVSVPVSIGQPPVVEAGPDQTVCASNPEVFLAGSVENATGGIWSGGSGTYTPGPNNLLIVYTPTAAEILAGSVTMTLTSSGAGGGCTEGSDNMTIYFSDTVFVNPTYAPISCNGELTTIDANASGGTGAYTYMWSTGENTSSIDVTAGTYSVTVSDIYGCSATTSINVSEPPVILLSMSSTNTSTDLLCDGTASVNISGGVAPYNVEWMDLQTTLTASGLCYGVATVTVTDALGCSSEGSVVVNNQTCSAFNVGASNTNVNCYGASTAQAFSFPSGGNTPYTYSWNTSPIQTTQNATGLSAGTYTVTVTDNVGCIDIASVTVIQPTIITNVMTHTDATSIGGSEGTATANPAGGTPGYTYTWNPTAQSTQTAVNLSEGVYYVNILDANLCLKTDSVQINQPPCNNFMLGVNTTNISCNGLSDGSAYIVIAQGTPPYSISWSTGQNNVTSVSGLPKGTHTVTVTDASNCTTFETFDITEPNALSIGLVPTNISCYGLSDGTIDLTVSGGTFPYTYKWTLGTSQVGDHEDLTHLKPGTYSVLVTDANGCTISGSVGVSQPNALNASYVYNDITCNGDDNGSINATISGGILPYTYSWNGPGGYTNSIEDITGLEPGLYELQIVDGNGCSLKNKIQSYINEPDSIKIISYSLPCPSAGADDVVLTIDSISGGAGGTYSVSFNGGGLYQSPGVYNSTLSLNASYDVYAKDSLGCVTPLPTTINIEPKVEITDVNFNPCMIVGTTNIDITVSSNGGDGGPYEVSTDGGMTFNPSGNYVISLPVGNSYSIVTRDGRGCQSLAWPIIIPSPLDANSILTNEASCPGAYDGSIDLNISGGTSPYIISWTGPSSFSSSLEDISSLSAGMYYYTITDDSSCVYNDSIEVTTIIDVTNPVFTFCPTSEIVNSNINECTYTVMGTSWDATGTDDCSVASITYTLTGATTGTGTTLDGVIFNVGVTTVTWTITDGSGNTNAVICQSTIEVIDNQLPSISSCGAVGNQNVIADGGVCTYTNSGTGWDAIASDNCSLSSIEYTLTGVTSGSGTSLDGVVFNLGLTHVTWNVTDNSGNISSCSFDVNVTDDQLPSISTCGAIGNQNVLADGSVCTYTNTGTAWDATATDNCSVSSIVYNLTGATNGSGLSLDGVTFNLGTTVVVWTVTDGTGNQSTCTFDVVVTDDQLPSISSCGAVGDQNVITDFGLCTYTKVGTGWNATANDNCTVSSIVYTLSGATSGSGTSLNGVSFNIDTTTVTWTVTDGSGNISTCTFDVIVTDNQLPSISSCGASGNQNVISDNGVCTYTVSGSAWDATATDNCSVSSIVYTLSGATTGTGTSLNGVSFNLGTTDVVWTVTDGSGNISSCTFKVIVSDDQLPSILSCGVGGNQNVLSDAGVCTYTNSGTGWDATAADNCSVSSINYSLSGATTGSGTSLDGVTFNLGTTTVIWTATDGSGNKTTCTYNVIVSDNQLPAISSCGAVGTQNVLANSGVCTYTNTGTGWNATATDNCSVSSIIYTLSGATSGSGTSLNNVVFNLGTTVVLWTVTDGSGNISTCTFDVVVTDDQLPSITSCGPIGSQTVNANIGTCTYTYSGTGWNAQATDNCSVSSIIYTLTGATSGSGTSLNGVTFNLGVTNVTWTVTDGSSNTASCSFQVTVIDTQLPVILSCGATGTQNVFTNSGVCTYTVSGTGWDATASDNCSIASINYTLTGATTGSGSSLNGVVFAKGTTTVTWLATDGSGNSASCSFQVLVTDNESPIISSCPSNINVNNDNGDCSAVVTWTPPTFTDNCGATMTSNYSPGATFNVGTTTVIYTVIDAAGNSSVCSFDINVSDNELPQISCNGDIVSCNPVVTYVDPIVSDNCGITSVTRTSGLPSGSTFPVGVTTVTYEVEDVNGNINSCSFDVTINPTPVLSTISEDITCNGAGNGTIDLTVTNGTSPYSYDWSDGSITQNISNLEEGVYSVLVTDDNGCFASISDTISEPELLSLTKSVSHVLCYNGNNGEIDLTISGGVQPYTYNWSNSEVSEDISNLVAGSYSVVVSDDNGCQINSSTTILQPDSINIQTVVTDATCNASNGSISALVTGGVSPYNYSWSSGSNSMNLSNVPGGNYTLTVTDNNGCIATHKDSVGTTSNLTGYIYGTDVLCYGEETGTALVVIETGNAPYTYTWSTGASSNQVNGLTAGNYTVHVQDVFGCEIDLDVEIDQPDSLIVELYSPEPLDGYNVSIYGGSDGIIQSSVSGGTPTYTYIWSPTGETTEDIFGLVSGSYSVIVTDLNGCVATAVIRLNQPQILEMPEGVSPNGDGQNDFFVIHGIEAYPNNEIVIYNRWGNIVYEQSGYNNEWQGFNNKGEELPDGTYFVIFNPSKDASVEPLTGYIDLRRKR